MTFKPKNLDELLADGNITQEEYDATKAWMVRKGTKYGAQKTTIDGITFDSKKESERYAQLKLMERAGEIVNLFCQVEFSIDVEGVHICNYVADFSYEDTRNGNQVVEDCKGYKTTVYRLKKKLMWACHEIKIKET